jgi:DNA-binding NarL/FixJ family response regulator
VSPEGESDAITLLVVDDSLAVLAGASALLDEADGIAVIGCCDNGREAVELAGRLRPDVVVLNLDMPGMDGVEACRLIKTTRPETKVVLHTGADRGRRAEEAVRAGVSGIQPKTGDAGAWIEAVRRVHRSTTS